MKAYSVCHKEDIPNNAAKGFSLDADSGEIVFFVVRKQCQYFAYVNSCPHTGINLEWLPDQFLDNENKLIQCSLHGAQFNIENGLCIFGPCLGRELRSIETRIDGDHLQIVTDY